MLIMFFSNLSIIILAIFIIIKIIIFLIQIIILNLYDPSLSGYGCNSRPKSLGSGCNARPKSLECGFDNKIVS
jgi:hypothetical protein